MNRLVLLCLLISAIMQIKKEFVSSKEVDVYWRDYTGTLPHDALPTGHGTYIAQMGLSNCGLIPGTLHPETHLVVSEGVTGRVETKSNIKVLCSTKPQSLRWEYVNIDHLSNDKILANAILGGHEIGFPLYIGKTFHEGQWKIGKVFPPTSSIKGLRVWYNNGGTYAVSDFQLLIAA